jgi:hypothetical protein
MKYGLCWVVILYLLTAGTVAHAIEGYSGSTWGTVYHEAAVNETFSLMNIYQGIDWLNYKGYRLNTFVQFRYRYLTPEGEFFNAYGPSLGISVKKWGVELGTEYIWQVRDDTPGIVDGPRVYLEWYYGWDLKKVFR